MLVAVAGALGELAQLGRHLHQQRRHRQLAAQLVHLGQVEAQHRLALARQRHAQGRGADVRVAVAVAADPVAHAEERRDLEAGQVPFDLRIELRDLAQEGALVVAERVVDLVGDAQLGGAQQAGLPQLRDAGAQRGLVLGALGLVVQAVAPADQLGHRALGVQHALALHLGRVRGQHRRQIGVLQHLGDLGGAHAAPRQLLEARGQRAVLLLAGELPVLAHAHVVAVLGQVGEMREVAEGAHHRHRLLDRQVLQQPVERAAGLCVALEPVGHRQLADALDQLEGRRALLLADHVAEDAAEQPNVLDHRAVDVVSVGARAGLGGHGGRDGRAAGPAGSGGRRGGGRRGC